MKQGARASRPRGAEGFEAYYAALFGERWPALQQSLLGRKRRVSLDVGGAQPYVLDPASICAALVLPVRSASSVADLCAAPGGKTLVLAGSLPAGAILWANERSPERTARLAAVVRDCLPAEAASRIRVSCSDASTWCRRQTDCFDAILLDAPCSSERYVLADARYLSDWSPARIKSLAIAQWALLSSAWRLLAPGGYLVYATCALSRQENDGVVERLLNKFSDARCVPMEDAFAANTRLFGGAVRPCGDDGPAPPLDAVFAAGEPTACGRHILPDAAQGCGPLYFSLVHKER